MKHRSLKRRQFIGALGTTSFALLPARHSPISRGLLSGKSRSPKPHQVAIAECNNYSAQTLFGALHSGWRHALSPDVKNRHVVIKPNIVDFTPDKPIETDARLIEALILLLKSHGAGKITLAEGPAHNRDSEMIFHKTGYTSVAKRQAVSLIDLNYDDVQWIQNDHHQGRFFEHVYLPETILSADVFISVAKMKTHRFAGVTLSLKNMLGILPGMMYGWPKNIIHWNGIPRSICEIAGLIKPHFVIIDGVVGMEGYGPLLGKSKQAGVLVFSDNALAADSTAARIMGVDPVRVEYMRLAQRFGLGSTRSQDINIYGGSIDSFRTNFDLEEPFEYLRAPKNAHP